MHNELYYKHSGRFSAMGPVVGFAAATVTAIILGVIYSLAVLNIPFIYVDALFCILYGMLVGAAAGRTIVWLKVRNPLIAIAVTVAATLVGYYVSWAFWVNGVLHRAEPDATLTMMDLVKNPGLLWAGISDINTVGTWSLGHSSKEAVSGAFLWITWLAEAGIIFGCAIMGVRLTTANPFCEDCETWCKEEKAVCRLAPGDANMLRSGLEAKDFSVLDRIGKKPGNASSWYQLDLHACGQCGKTNTLTATLMTQTLDKKGKATTKTKKVVDRLLLDMTERNTFLEACGRVQAVTAT